MGLPCGLYSYIWGVQIANCCKSPGLQCVAPVLGYVILGPLERGLVTPGVVIGYMLKVVLDYDGTLTAEEQQVPEVTRRSLLELADRILKVPLKELR